MLPAAVLFDFDGILVDTEFAIYEAWQATFRRFECDLPLSMYTRCIGSDFNTWSPKTYLEGLTGQGYDWEKMDADRQVGIRVALEKQGPIDGVVAILEELKSRGVVLAVVSSSSHDWVDGWFDRLGLMSCFRKTICRGDAARIKPAPDLYLAAAEKLGLQPADCLVVEDSLNGLIAAHAAGMKTWVVPNRVTEGLDFSLADKVFDDFEEMAQALFPV